MKKRGEAVLSLSKKVLKWIKPYSKKVEIVGSIRRKVENPRDVDVVLIPKNQYAKEKIEQILESRGRKTLGGEKKAYFKVQGINVELYYTIPEEWGAALLAYSSKKGSGIGLRIVARKKGFKLSQHGLFKGSKRVVGRTEQEIYHALGRPYKEPWNR